MPPMVVLLTNVSKVMFYQKVILLSTYLVTVVLDVVKSRFTPVCAIFVGSYPRTRLIKTQFDLICSKGL
ncbi:hypothetical protein A2U01_0062190, partial [Trifolium medium]|nr:hypothetical protein [Trifolium medium]